MRLDARGYSIDMAAGSNLDYGFDWSEWLAVDETITTSTWASNNDDLVLADDAIVSNDTGTIVFASEGVANTTVRITNTITTSEGRIDKRSINLVIKIR